MDMHVGASGSKAIYLAHPSITSREDYKTIANHENFLDHDAFASPDPDGCDAALSLLAR